MLLLAKKQLHVNYVLVPTSLVPKPRPEFWMLHISESWEVQVLGIRNKAHIPPITLNPDSYHYCSRISSPSLFTHTIQTIVPPPFITHDTPHRHPPLNVPNSPPVTPSFINILRLRPLNILITLRCPAITPPTPSYRYVSQCTEDWRTYAIPSCSFPSIKMQSHTKVITFAVQLNWSVGELGDQWSKLIKTLPSLLTMLPKFAGTYV